MSISSRQSELFTAENWQVLYQAFTSINFNASDPATINAALQQYIRVNYPEDFNDWIASSEFVAIIDLLSWLAGNLAFKTDLSVRENFADTAEARSSILRLARFLSYNPSRNQPAVGLVKVVAIATNDDVTDSFGNNLINQTILWGDPDNENWLDQSTCILNNAFAQTNPFGLPLKTGYVNTTSAQVYRVNSYVSQTNLGYSTYVGGSSMSFEVCDADFDGNGNIFERAPDPQAAFHLLYLNDGLGANSTETGFFMMFKQGQTTSQLFGIASPVENQTIDITDNGVNQNDVWVQTIDQNGLVSVNWTKVPSVLSANITYNALPASQRNIFSVISRDNDAVTIRFSDGRFGNAPYGNIQVTYRVSNGLAYTIKPQEMSQIVQTFSFYNSTGALKTISLTFALQESVSNAAPAETIEQIRSRMTSVYATQNRMVSGEDYNTFPLSTNLAIKVKALNRVYSGQSRYIDLNDPTGTYQDLSIFADDGIYFNQAFNAYREITLTPNLTSAQIIGSSLQPMLSAQSVNDAVRDIYLRSIQAGLLPLAVTPNVWNQSSASLYTSTGYFQSSNVLLQPGCMLQVTPATGLPYWVGLVSIVATSTATSSPYRGSAGPVTLTQTIPDQSVISTILPAFLPELPSSLVSTMQGMITNRLSFALGWDCLTNNGSWVILPSQVLATNALINNPLTASNSVIPVATMDFLTAIYRIRVIGLRSVFESLSTVEWFDDGIRAIDMDTGAAGLDTVSIMRFNTNINDPFMRALPRSYDLAVGSIYTYADGTPEPRRTQVKLVDSNGDGFPDDPDTFFRIAPYASVPSLLFWSTTSAPYVTPLYGVVIFANDTQMNATTDLATGTVAFVLAGVGSITYSQTFWVFTAGVWIQDINDTYSFAEGRGPNVGNSLIIGNDTVEGDFLNFHWKHYAPSDHRIDPAQTNLHDIFVLTYSYDLAVRQWIANGAAPALMPMPPTEFDLRVAFASMNDFRMFSDGIVWRPVRYKMLFGQASDPELQVQFKVVRLPNASTSDNEIKTAIINAINAYFVADNWDFGDTFYFTELAAYIHQQLAGQIGSIVPVPLSADGQFGDSFEVACRADEIFISTAQVSDIVIIASNTPAALRLR